MGVVFHSLERFGFPFVVVDERKMVLPRQGTYRLRNARGKVLFVLGGECYLSFAEGKPLLFQEGDALVIPGYCDQTYYAPEKGKAQTLHTLRVVFEDAFSHLSDGLEPEFSFNAFICHHFPQPMLLPRCMDTRISALLHELRKEVEEKLPGFRHRIHDFCRSLIVILARKQHQLEAPLSTLPRPGRVDTVNLAKEYILKNLTSDLRLGEIAWHAEVSEEHLSRIFRKITGQTVFSYIRQMRLETAKTYLSGTGMSVTEVASRCGFSSAALFSRNFKEYVGINAREYRIRHVGNLEDVRSGDWVPTGFNM